MRIGLGWLAANGAPLVCAAAVLVPRSQHACICLASQINLFLEPAQRWWMGGA